MIKVAVGCLALFACAPYPANLWVAASVGVGFAVYGIGALVARDRRP